MSDQTVVLALRGRVTPTGLELPETLSHEEWTEVGRGLQSAGRSIAWWIGDWMRFGEARWGERYRDALETFGLSYQTARNIASVAGGFELSRRRDNLTWSHHETVASLDAETADALLDQAASERWSVRELRVAARRRKNAVGCLPGSETCTVEDLYGLIAKGHRYRTIYADPPWRYGNTSSRGAAEDHYPTLSLDDLRALPVAELAADDCHLHLWATVPLLPEAFETLEAWDFEYRSQFIWTKPGLGLGNYWRVSAEIMLLGVRGHLPFDDNSQRNWKELERTEHSAKPEEIRRLIELVSPGPRLELFARCTAPGWTVWGNEVAPEEGLGRERGAS